MLTATGNPTAVVIANFAYDLLRPFLVPVVMAIGCFIVAELKQHGYQTTYATALVRAVGSGFAAAEAQGLDPFSGAGQRVIVDTGTSYLEHTVSGAASALGISAEDHAVRLVAQIGAVRAQGEAVAQAMPAVVTLKELQK